MFSKWQILLQFPLIKLFGVFFEHEVVLPASLTLLGSGTAFEAEHELLGHTLCRCC